MPRGADDAVSKSLADRAGVVTITDRSGVDYWVDVGLLPDKATGLALLGTEKGPPARVWAIFASVFQT